MTSFRLLCIAALSTATLSCNAKASILPLPTTLSRTVSLQGLDLTRDNDWNEAHRRIQQTAKKVCSQLFDDELRLSLDRDACFNDSLIHANHVLLHIREAALARLRGSHTSSAPQVASHN